MKVGLSFSRCIKDIVDGKVDINDVLVIIARTDFDPHIDEEWAGIWEGYAGGTNASALSLIALRSQFGGSNPEWYGYKDEDEDRFRSVSIELWESGKFHQPRKFGAWPSRRKEIWLETVLISDEIENNPAVKSAWEKFQTVAGLTNTKLNKEYR